MTTTPNASPELPDLDKLEALARAATPGPWAYQEDSDVYTHIVRPAQSPGRIVHHYSQDTSGVVEANARFTAGANPAAVLALIALARRAQPEGEAPQASAWELGLEDADGNPLHLMRQDVLSAAANFISSAALISARIDGADMRREDFAALLKAPSGKAHAVTLSPLCGAQQNLELVVARLEQIVEGCDNASERAEEALICMRAALGAQHAESGKEAVPMCEGCDNAATLHADGTTGLCNECVADDASAPGTPEAPRELPPLPTPTARMYSQNGYRRASVSAGKGEPLFAADQMRDYARAAQLDSGQEGSGS